MKPTYKRAADAHRPPKVAGSSGVRGAGPRRGRAAAIALAAVLSIGAAAHITPTVTLRKHADVIRSTLPGAKQYFVREVKIGRQDLRRLRTEASFSPEDRELRFFYATAEDDAMIGVVLFPQVNTQHGPLEVGLTLDPSGAVTGAVVTKVTAETKPWVLKAVRAGLMDGFVGMRFGDDTKQALQRVAREGLGKMPYFFAGVTAEAVHRGLALYEVLFAEAE
ncbi:MAG: hypothetical protein ACE5HP_11165 [Gemmatimonadota bacterium]